MELLLTWRDRAIHASLAHYMQSQQYRLYSIILTIINLCAGISVLFLANNKVLSVDSDIVSKAMLSVASLFVVLGSALQYVLRLEDKLHMHKMAGNGFTEIKRKIEFLLAVKKVQDFDVEKISIDYNHNSKFYPLVRQSIWKKSEKRYNESVSQDENLKCLLGNTQGESNPPC